VYGDHCLNGVLQISDEFADAYSNNTCILSKARDTYLGWYNSVGSSSSSSSTAGARRDAEASGPTCDTAHGDFHLRLGGNTVYSPGGDVTINCMRTDLNATAWMAHGLDKGTTFHDSASLTSKQIVSMGMAILANGD